MVASFVFSGIFYVTITYSVEIVFGFVFSIWLKRRQTQCVNIVTNILNIATYRGIKGLTFAPNEFLIYRY